MIRNFPFIFTFYSYKGGVGRSMSMLNTAFELSRLGRNVLLLDMDLEAPGISNFLSRNNEFEKEPEKDIIHLLSDILDFEKKGGHYENTIKEMNPVSTYISPIKKENLIPLKHRRSESGKIDVIPALVHDKNYWSRLSDLDLGSLDRKALKKAGIILKHYLKSQHFAAHSEVLDEFGETPPKVPYDYILIDSRTGITESGGLCIGPLADRLVILTGLNDQNIQGTRDMMRIAGIETGEKTSDEKWDEGEPDRTDMERPPLMGPKPTLLVASPVPNGEIEYKRQRLDQLDEKLGPHAAQLSYHPQMALMESIFVRDYPEEYLSIEYKGLVSHILTSARDNDSHLIDSSQKAIKKNKATETAVQYLLRLYRSNPNLGIQLIKQFHNNANEQFLSDSNDLADNEFQALCQMYHCLLSNTKEDHIAQNALGQLLSNQAKSKQGKAADKLFELSYQKYQMALDIKPDKHEALNNWGNALSDQAKSKQGKAADKLLELSYQKYQLALDIKPDDHEALFNQACLCAIQGDTQQAIDTLKLITTPKGADLVKKIKSDSDFDSILNQESFQAFLASLESVENKKKI